MGRIKALITDREAKPLDCCISDAIEYPPHQLHLRIVGGQPPAELNERTAREVVHFFVDIQGIAPADVKAESIQGLLIAQVVPLLQETQAQQSGNAEIGPAGSPVERRIVIFFPEQDGKHLAPEQVSP